MIHCEEKLLRSVNASIKKYAADHTDGEAFYRDIDMLRDLSLQSVSLDDDMKYFDRVNKLVGVFITIVMRPYIINERETVILRAEQAYGLTPEMFRETVVDAKLWKDKRGVMTPEEVYYFRNVDELRNYENRFVVHLIDIIFAELMDHLKFYDFLIGTVMSGNALTQKDSSLDKAYARLESLVKKLKRIKETEFYKIVSTSDTSFTHVEPTNVFKHNKVYGACYRFYVTEVAYGDAEARADDLSAYFFTRLLIALRTEGYVYLGGAKGRQRSSEVKFGSDEFTITVKKGERAGLRVVIEDKCGYAHTDNRLVFDGTMDFEETQADPDNYKETATSLDAMSIWDFAYVEDKVVPMRWGGASENELTLRYLRNKTRTFAASRQIYGDHCPVCGSKNIAAAKFLRCSDCGTEYTFVGEKIWLTKLRKR